MKIITTILTLIKASFMPKHPDFEECGIDTKYPFKE